jgi:hypothetical protein
MLGTQKWHAYRLIKATMCQMKKRFINESQNNHKRFAGESQNVADRRTLKKHV